MQGQKVCFITGDTRNLHEHHVFGGCRRRASEAWGCKVWLRADWHNPSDYGVHFDTALDRRIKEQCQKRFEAIHGHEAFMAVFGKNFIQCDQYEGEGRDSQDGDVYAHEPSETSSGGFRLLACEDLPY